MLDGRLGRQEEVLWSAARNCSATPRALCALLGVAAALAGAIALGWAWFGAWLILPFAGAEVLALALALLLHARRTRDRECIALRAGMLVVEIRERELIRRHEFNAQWAQLVAAPRRLALRYGGRELEIGRHLDEARRGELAMQLDRLLREARRP